MSTLSASRWIFLLSLAVVMLFSASPVQSSVPDIELFCCGNEKHPIEKTKIHQDFINECYEQKKRSDCNHHAFVVITGRKTWCISPKAKWINSRLARGDLVCPPDIQL